MSPQGGTRGQVPKIWSGEGTNLGVSQGGTRVHPGQVPKIWSGGGTNLGVSQGGTRGQVPKIWSGGNTNLDVSPKFVLVILRSCI